MMARTTKAATHLLPQVVLTSGNCLLSSLGVE
jgi:hypothetical protein